jgi:tetratricopeptide (TPR) repeat protein
LHFEFAHFLAATGRADEAVAQAKRTLQLDPASPWANSGVAIFFYFTRRYDEAIQQSLRVLETAPNYSLAHLFLGLAYEQKEEFSRAVPELKRSVGLSGDRVIPAFVAHAYALSGQRDEARRILQDLKQPSGKNYVEPWLIALVYVGLGEEDQAMEWLEKAYQNRSHDIVFSKVLPQFDPVRSDPRFRELLRRMNFPPNTPNSPN